MDTFTAIVKRQAWIHLQLEIEYQKASFSRDYDSDAVIHGVASRIAWRYNVSYAKVVTYLETRYKEQDDE